LEVAVEVADVVNHLEMVEQVISIVLLCFRQVAVLVPLPTTQGQMAELVLDQPEQAEDLADIVDILVMVLPEQAVAVQVVMLGVAEEAARGTVFAASQVRAEEVEVVLVAQDNILAEAAELDCSGKAVAEPAVYGLQITHVAVVVDPVEVLVLLLQ